MRTLCIEEYNKEYNLDATLKQKMKGRNRDIHVRDMDHYAEIQTQIDLNKYKLEEIDDKAQTLDNNSNDINNIVNNLKKSPIVKNKYLIDKKEKEKLFIKKNYFLYK